LCGFYSLKSIHDSLTNWLKRKSVAFVRNTSGNMAILTAFLLPAVVAGAAVAIDYSSIYSSNTKLQEAADASAIASAHEMVLPNASASTIQAAAANYVAANLTSSKGFFVSPPTVTVTTDIAAGTVKIDITGYKKNTFGGFLQPEVTKLNAIAVARSLGGASEKTCVIVLDPSAKWALEMGDGSKLKAVDCAVQSNSASRWAMWLGWNSVLTASKICSTGGVDNGGGVTSVKIITDCPAISDPLAYKMPPPVGGCDYNKMVITGTDSVLIDPGVYCGGLTLKKDVIVDMRPGIHVFKDGPLQVTDRATLKGKNVGLYFLGDRSIMLLRKATTIELTAPKTGPMAGLLMFSDRGNSDTQRFTITSDFARVLLGTIYLPNGILYIDAGELIADKSAFTVVVARKFETSGAPEIVVNSNYNSTDIPVPDGVGPNAPNVKKIVLVE